MRVDAQLWLVSVHLREEIVLIQVNKLQVGRELDGFQENDLFVGDILIANEIPKYLEADLGKRYDQLLPL